MPKDKIAFQGEKGAYSHLACEEIFPGSSIKTCSTFEETFKTAHDDDSYKNESLIVINKIDLLERSELIAIQERFKEAIFISAKNKLMIDNVFDNIKTKIESSYQTAVVTFSASSGKEIASVFDHVEVIEQNYEPNIVKLKIRGQRSMIRKILKLSRNG